MSKSDAIHPMRDLRYAVGTARPELKSQHNFAAYLGISRSLLDKIERRVHDCTEDVAKNACLLMGVWPPCLVKQGMRPLLGIGGNPYKPEDFLDFQELLQSGNEQDAERLAAEAAILLKALFVAAARQGQLFPTVLKLDRMLESSRTEQNLGDEIQRILESDVQSSRARYENIEHFLSETGLDKDASAKPGIDAEVGKLARAGILLNQPFTVETLTHPAWHSLLSSEEKGRGFCYWYEILAGERVFTQGKVTARWPMQKFKMEGTFPNPDFPKTVPSPHL